MHALIMGGGKIGTVLAEALLTQANTVTIIHDDLNDLQRLTGELQVEGVAGDGATENDLRKAGIHDAQVFIAVTTDDNRNAMAAQIAKYIFHVDKVVCQINDPARQIVYQDLGINAICPTLVGADMLLNAVER